MDTIKREIVTGDDLKDGLKRGINKLADTVKVTMGPKGKLVLIQKPIGHPVVTKDGVTVANAINLVDEVENLAAQIIKEAAARTADQAGDGTTTATVLSQSIYTQGLKMIAAGYDVEDIKVGIEKSVNEVARFLEEHARPVDSEEDMKKVAVISANGEEEIAELIVKAISSAGPDGHVIVEEAKGFKSSLTVVDGYKIERGYLSPYFITDKNKMSCEFDNPLILMLDKSVNSIHEVMKPLEAALEAGRPILVIANDIDGEALQGLVLNKAKGSLRVCGIKSPGFGGTRQALFSDLETVVGGKVLGSTFDIPGNFDFEMFGTCKKVIIGKSSALFVNDKNKKSKSVEQKIKTIKHSIDNDPLEKDELELLKYRVQALAGGIAILRVGAATESELIERYDRVDDALNATRAALVEGTLPGGGVMLAKCSFFLDEKIKQEKDLGVAAGINVIKNACMTPFQQIIANAGLSAEVYIQKIKNEKQYDWGFDLRKNTTGNMYEMGIIDPKKVVRCALENAASASAMLLSAGSSLIDVGKN